MGVVACALTAVQISAILNAISVTGSHSDQSVQPPTPKKAGPVVPQLSLLDQVSLAVQIRGLVLLLQSVPSSATRSFKVAQDIPHESLDSFFAHPLVPPKTNHSYTRFIMETFKADFSVSTTLEKLTAKSGLTSEHLERGRVSQAVLGKTSSSLGISVGDLSACAFCIPHNAIAEPAAHETYVLPILLTDPFLFTQYRPENYSPPAMERHSGIPPESIRTLFPTFPEFEILDWTSKHHRTSQAKVSLWRVKPSAGYRHSHRQYAGSTPVSPSMMPSSKTITQELDTRTSVTPESTCRIHVNVIPLHLFVDMGSAAAALDFLETLSNGLISSGSDVSLTGSGSSDSEGEGHEGARAYANSGDPTPPSSPHIRALQRIHQQELEDLNLSVDYLTQETVPAVSSPKLRRMHGHTRDLSHRDSLTEFDVTFTMVRVQLRCPSPSSLPQRSGAVILDVHWLNLTSRTPLGVREVYSRHQSSAKNESTTRNPSSRDNHLLTVEWGALLLAYSSAGAAAARSFCSIGPLSSVADNKVASSQDHIHFLDDALSITRSAFITLALNPPSSFRRNSKRPPRVVTEIQIPSMCLNISKTLFDGLQFWIDDLSRLLEQTLTGPSNGLRENSSKNPSLVGSRFFSRSKQNSPDMTIDENSRSQTLSTESVIKVTISQASMRLLYPHQDDGASEPFDIFAFDLDALLESRPEGRNETVITLSIMGVTVLDAVSPLSPLLSLAAPPSLFSPPRPLVKLRFSSTTFPETASKESRVRLTLHGFTLNFVPNIKRLDALIAFARPPPGVFETVVPNERTQITVKIIEGSVRLFAPTNTGALVLHLGDLDLSTEVVGDSPEMRLRTAGHALTALFINNYLEAVQDAGNRSAFDAQGVPYWKRLGYALIGEISDFALALRRSNTLPVQSEASIDHITVRIHLCADTGSALGLYFGDFGTAFEVQPDRSNTPSESKTKQPTIVSPQETASDELTYSIDQHAFQSVPEVGAAPDMINDDLPCNPDYLDVSFGAAAGLRELSDDDLEMDDPSQTEPMGGAHFPSYSSDNNVISSVGGETIKILDSKGLQGVENFFNTLPALAQASPQLAEVLDRVIIREGDITLFLYEGYDWVTTRKAIEEEVKKMKRRLTRIKQLVASGQAYDPSIDPTNTVLFNSIHVGLDQDADEMEPDALIAAIDEQLMEDNDAASVSSWQSLRPTSGGRVGVPPLRLHGRRLTRSRGPSIEIHLSGFFAEAVKFFPNDEFVSRTFATVKDLEILDHVKTSTWRKFLTALRSDSRGNIRETGSNMVRIELCGVHPVPGNTSEETRLRVKILPLRLHVDQDALDFLKKFFNFQSPNISSDPEPRNETYLQRAEVYPVALKLDYKPRRVDYRALREGRTIELMNFFHFDGAEMTLRHLTVFGVVGWPRFFDMLNDLWTPDVKATQLADVISGVSPIRSVVNVGSGVADLVLLPIAQYRKDGRVVRGLQKGTKAFVRSTAMEAVKLGAQLATGTQVILEQAENVLGSKFNEPVLAEAVSHPFEDGTEAGPHDWSLREEPTDPISKYAEQPVDIREGIQSAYTSIRRNLSSAAQTILAVPMEVFERSGEACFRVPVSICVPLITI
ncbi:hypothetical protein B0F90DRAFT_1690173 [Multifurca ochricompacta]|uniref:Autophagy-related protein 2 n=1 Tax=Multifurca ochricompacta TaxID=376703 RepID=A0AAD4MAA4_9AGAM|nr:hypothetical protein B0F90DRAFT_1690173 [Multifurca ochricompacta]